jgi:hypothetical protein
VTLRDLHAKASRERSHSFRAHSMERCPGEVCHVQIPGLAYWWMRDREVRDQSSQWDLPAHLACSHQYPFWPIQPQKSFQWNHAVLPLQPSFFSSHIMLLRCPSRKMIYFNDFQPHHTSPPCCMFVPLLKECLSLHTCTCEFLGTETKKYH